MFGAVRKRCADPAQVHLPRIRCVLPHPQHEGGERRGRNRGEGFLRQGEEHLRQDDGQAQQQPRVPLQVCGYRGGSASPRGGREDLPPALRDDLGRAAGQEIEEII